MYMEAVFPGTFVFNWYHTFKYFEQIIMQAAVQICIQIVGGGEDYLKIEPEFDLYPSPSFLTAPL